jgi:hypothetical protein
MAPYGELGDQGGVARGSTHPVDETVGLALV